MTELEEKDTNLVEESNPSTTAIVVDEAPHLEHSEYEQLTQLLNKTQLFSEFVKEQAEKVLVHARSGDSLLVGGTLHPHQKSGVDWLLSLYMNGMNGILADEMGLGKTITIVSYLAQLWSNYVFGPHAVICPLSTIENWAAEFSKWCPTIPIILYYGDPQERKEKREAMQAFADNAAKNPRGPPSVVGKQVGYVLLTSYEIAMKDKRFLKKISWTALVVDEAHRLKNFNCRLIKDLKELSTVNRILLTGTPLQNKLSELWSILNFVMPEVFPTLSAFSKWFEVDNLEDYDDVETTVLHSDQQQEMIQRIHRILRPFVLRRLKSEVGLYIPPKKEVVVRCAFTPKHLEAYNTVLDGNLTAPLQNRLIQLRKVCCHPYLFDEFEPEASKTRSQKSKLNDMLSACGKLATFHRIVSALHTQRRKVVVFSQMTTVLDILEDYFAAAQQSARCVRLDGHVKAVDRAVAIQKFREDKAVDVFLISTRAGGVGLNLQVADTVIIYDADFNPQNDLQAMDRCHRIGQQQAVIVYRLIMKDSVEEHILAKCEQKLRMHGVVIEKGRLHGGVHAPAGEITVSFSRQDLEEILKKRIGDRRETLAGDEKLLLRLLDRDYILSRDDAEDDESAAEREVKVKRKCP